jgi:hypothetical protein
MVVDRKKCKSDKCSSVQDTCGGCGCHDVALDYLGFNMCHCCSHDGVSCLPR